MGVAAEWQRDLSSTVWRDSTGGAAWCQWDGLLLLRVTSAALDGGYAWREGMCADALSSAVIESMY
jgi:hypothetical protein